MRLQCAWSGLAKHCWTVLKTPYGSGALLTEVQIILVIQLFFGWTTYTWTGKKKIVMNEWMNKWMNEQIKERMHSNVRRTLRVLVYTTKMWTKKIYFIITVSTFCTHGFNTAHFRTHSFTAQLASYFVQEGLFFDNHRWFAVTSFCGYLGPRKYTFFYAK